MGGGVTIKSICGQENEKTGNPILLSPFFMLGMKLTLYSALNLLCLSAGTWEGRTEKHGVLFLFKVPLFLLGFGANREPSRGAWGPCWSPHPLMSVCCLDLQHPPWVDEHALAQFPCFGQNSQGSGKWFHDQS